MCTTFCVGTPSVNATNALAENLLRLPDFSSYIPQTQFITLENYSNILPEYTFPNTISGTSIYFQRFASWKDAFGLEFMNGTNAFPTFAWSGNRNGSSTLVNSQILESSRFNFPATFLEFSKGYTKVGTIYAGQGVQLFFSNGLGILPFQQGRGIYDYISYQVSYEENVVNNIDYPTTYGPEGIQPGRNNAFIGVALTKNFSDSLNLKNQEYASKTSQDTRYLLTRTKPNITLQATNGPLVYVPPSDPNENTYNGLPWNALNAFLTGQSITILRNGITTMCISGSYPLYRGSHSTEYSGFITSGPLDTGEEIYEILPQYLSKYLSQYYLTSDFWNPNFNIPLNSNLQTAVFGLGTRDSNYAIPVVPNSPYYLKGGRIVLYEGQCVIAGSYVYASMNMVGNVAVSPFVSPSSKEIRFNGTQNTTFMQDLYGKYQGNQGSLIVMVTTDDSDPVIVPSCCQPVGIVMETIIGAGSPQFDVNEQIYYTQQTSKSTGQQTIPESFENTLQLQSRQITVKLFPMFGNVALSGYSNFCFQQSSTVNYFRTGQPFTNNSFYKPSVFTPTLTESTAPYGFCYQKIRSLYTLHDSPFSFIPANNNFISNITINYPYPYNETGIRGKQFMNDYYGPESYFSSTFFYSIT
jgi:hypothetical protein